MSSYSQEKSRYIFCHFHASYFEGTPLSVDNEQQVQSCSAVLPLQAFVAFVVL